MKLLINQKPTDFTLEHEKNVGDVLNSLRKWGNPKNLFLTEVILDEKVIPCNSEKHADYEQPLNTINEMKVNFLSSASYAMKVLIGLNDYLENVHQMIQDKQLNLKKISTLIDNLTYIHEGFQNVCQTLHMKISFDKVNALLKQIELLLFEAKESLQDQTPLNQEVFQKIQAFMQHLLTETKMLFFCGNLAVLKQTLLEAETQQEPFDGVLLLQDFLSHLLDLKYVLTEASTCFQSGNDFQAMRYVEHVIDTFVLLLGLFDKMNNNSLTYLSQYANLIQGDAYEAWQKTLKQQLLDLEDAMKTKDYVCVSDILEYELTTTTQQLVQRFEKLMQKAS